MFSEAVRSSDEISSLSNNSIIGEMELVNSSISFEGVGNVLHCEGNVRLVNSTVRFRSTGGGLLYLSSNKHPYQLDLTIWNDSTIAFGKDCYLNGCLHAIASERQSIIIGDDCLMSFGIWMRTADPHLLYSCDTHKRINGSEGIFIGDHVWLGQDSMVLKGSRMGSGSILAAKALLSGKNVPSNQCWGGVPARMVSNNVFYRGDSVHAYTVAQSQESQVFNSNRYIYSETAPLLRNIDISELATYDPLKRLDAISKLFGSDDKNRFAIAERPEPFLLGSWRKLKNHWMKHSAL